MHERKLSSLMKKMKEGCKLDINQSVPENILSRPEVLASCFGLMTDSAVVDSALVDAALRKSGLISNGKE